MPTATKATRARVSLAPLPGLADADLVRRARDGDDRAFEEIVRRYRAPLIRYSSRHVGRDHAEDVTQHAFARAHLHLRDDPRPIHLRAWLYRVAHNAAINMRARKDWGHEELSPDVDGVPQPPEVAAQRNEVREVVANMDGLPERQGAALRMSVFEGLDYEEIARRLDTSPNSVRALLSRARARLRKAAAAISPIPLLAWLSRKTYGLAGATAGGEGSFAAVGSVAQAKLIAIAATTVVAGAATVDRASSNGPDAAPQPQAAVSAPAPSVDRAVPLGVDSLIAKVEAPEPVAEEPAPPPAEEVPAEEVPVEPVVEPPVTEEPAPVEPPAPVADPPVDDSAPKDPPADDGGGDPPPDSYVDDGSGDGYTNPGDDPYGTTEGDAYTDP
jgi:RNA polymerase sigma factor (sigma-70 family)